MKDGKNRKQSEAVRENGGRRRSWSIGFPPRLLAVLIFLALVIPLFWGLLFRDRQFAYRDIGYFYYPLFRQVQDSLDAGKIPLWDPYENLGQPLAANPAASVFYPVKAIFFLPKIIPAVSYDACFKTFILIHVAAAFFFFYGFVRRRVSDEEPPLLSPTAGIFAAAAWTFGGSILFQTSNVIFLVGAAWLPLLAMFGLRLTRSGGVANLFGLACVLFMMITGGDPQTAFLGVVVLFVYALTVGGGNKSAAVFGRSASELRKRGPLRVCARLAGAVMLAVGLAAIQIIPTLETVRYSSRTGHNGPGVSEKPSSGIDSFLCRDFDAGGHQRATYNFSVPPWRVAEFIWPNVGGREFPENARWFSSLPNDARVWSPSLYMGLYPVLFAASAFLFWRRKKRMASVEAGAADEMTGANKANGEIFHAHDGGEWRDSFRLFLSWMTLATLLAAFGGFGVGWLLRLTNAWIHSSGAVDLTFHDGDPVGGVYWFLTRFLPGFAAFRYPAKMMTFVSFGMAVLAGFGWDRFWRAMGNGESQADGPLPTSGFRCGVGILTAVSLAGLVWSFFGDPILFFGKIAGVAPFSNRSIYGPCDAESARRFFTVAFFQTSILAGGLTFFLYAAGRLSRNGEILSSDPFSPANQTQRRFTILGQGMLLTTLIVDLYLAQAWLIADAPGAVFRTDSAMTAAIREACGALPVPTEETGGEVRPPIRLFRDSFLYPTRFLTATSPNRLAERVIWDRATLFQKNSQRWGIANMDVRGTFVAGDYSPISGYLRSELRRVKKTGKGSDALDRLLGLLDADVLISSDSAVARWTDAGKIGVGDDNQAGGQEENRVGTECPSQIISNQIKSRKWPVGTAARKIPGPKGRVRILHSPKDRNTLVTERWESKRPGESVVLTRYDADRIEFDVTLVEPARILVADEFYPGWCVTSKPLGAKSGGENPSGELSSDAAQSGNIPSNEIQNGEAWIPVQKMATCLRGFDLPPGKFHVVMEYRPRSFTVGVILTVLTWAACAVFFGFARKRKMVS